MNTTETLCISYKSRYTRFFKSQNLYLVHTNKNTLVIKSSLAKSYL